MNAQSRPRVDYAKVSAASQVSGGVGIFIWGYDLWTFGPEDVSPPAWTFASWTFRPCTVRPWKFRPWTIRPLVVKCFLLTSCQVSLTLKHLSIDNNCTTLCFEKTGPLNLFIITAKIALMSMKIGTHNLHMT